MKVGVISDTHDEMDAIAVSLAEFRARSVDCLIHCGDITSPDAAWLFTAIPTHFVLGNCDVPTAALREALTSGGNRLHEPFGSLELVGRTLVWTHGDDMALLRQLIASGCDYVFHGHTHRAEQIQRQATRIINPGALHRVRERTVLILDLASGESESVVIVSPQVST